MTYTLLLLKGLLDPVLSAFLHIFSSALPLECPFQFKGFFIHTSSCQEEQRAEVMLVARNAPPDMKFLFMARAQSGVKCENYVAGEEPNNTTKYVSRILLSAATLLDSVFAGEKKKEGKKSEYVP